MGSTRLLSQLLAFCSPTPGRRHQARWKTPKAQPNCLTALRNRHLQTRTVIRSHWQASGDKRARGWLGICLPQQTGSALHLAGQFIIVPRNNRGRDWTVQKRKLTAKISEVLPPGPSTTVRETTRCVAHWKDILS